MTEKELLAAMAETILSRVNSFYRGFRHDMEAVAHLNGSIFSHDKMFRHSATVVIRMLLNIAQMMSNTEFRRMVFELADIIHEAAQDESLDAINNEHAATDERQATSH